MARPLSIWRCAYALAACLMLAAAASGQVLPDFGSFPTGRLGQAVPVKVTAEFTPATDSQPALVFVTAKIDRGYHMFAPDQGTHDDGGPQATSIAFDAATQVKTLGALRSIEAPVTHIDQEVWKGLEIREYYDRVTFVIPVELPAGSDPAALALAGRLEGQACTPSSCTSVDVPFTAKAGKGVALPPGFLTAAAPAPTVGSAGTVAVAQGPISANSPLLLVALYGVLGGLILNLMPCVLPVLGLKLLSFAKQGGASRARILGLNLAYVAGLMTVLMVLATLAALVQLGLSGENYGWGELNTLTWFKVTMTGLLFAMALSFLGVWEIPIPGFAASGTATELAAQEGPVGAYCMGIFTTLLATPCAGPFLGPVLGYTITQPPAVTYLVFASIGLGLALPYLLIGAFPALVARLPKPGAWMDTFKQILGFVLLGSVVYMFSTINSDYFLATLALVFSIWFGCWMIGRAPAWAEAAYKRKEWLKGIAAAAIIGGSSFAILSPSEAELPWQPYSPAALAAARAQGKTVLVDFTANWCLTCKLNLRAAINRAKVRDLIKENNVVPLLADWTDKNDEIKRSLAELNSLSIPLMAIYPANPDAEVLVLRDLLTQSDVLDALEQAGPSRAAAPQGTKTASRNAEPAASEL